MTKTLIAMTAIALFGEVSAAELHPADMFDIKHEAAYAVQHQMIKAGEPQKVSSGGYKVPVSVNGKICTVLVKPYTPSSIEPPSRWKAVGQPVCEKI